LPFPFGGVKTVRVAQERPCLSRSDASHIWRETRRIAVNAIRNQ
jgi:hypothetical protein